MKWLFDWNIFRDIFGPVIIPTLVNVMTCPSSTSGVNKILEISPIFAQLECNNSDRL